MLEAAQSAMMRALEWGPEALPEGLFTGPAVRVLMGMKVHANTIAHARLVALEDTFPRTRRLLGHDRFNKRSRRFAGLPGATAQPLTRIGQDFPGFLGDTCDDRLAADLARFEWLWLEAYHAPEAMPLRLATLAGIDEAELLEIAVAAHPSAHILSPDRSMCNLIGEEVPGLSQSSAILIARPDIEVLVSPATIAMARIFSEVTADRQIPATIGNLFADLTEPDRKDRLPPDDFMPALIALLEAGALQALDSDRNNRWDR